METKEKYVLTEKEIKLRENIIKLREEIRKRAEIQRLFRYLRKTVHNPFTEEQQEKFSNRIDELCKELNVPRYYLGWNGSYELMHLYMAYNVLRKKEPVIPTKKTYSMDKLTEIVNKYNVQ